MVEREYPFEIHPVNDGPSIVDLSRVFANLVGTTKSLVMTKNADLMASMIGEYRNTVFVLAD